MSFLAGADGAAGIVPGTALVTSIVPRVCFISP